jgi:hypothetical protein
MREEGQGCRLRSQHHKLTNQMQMKKKTTMVQEGPSLSLSRKIVFQEVPIYWASKDLSII